LIGRTKSIESRTGFGILEIQEIIIKASSNISKPGNTGTTWHNRNHIFIDDKQSAKILRIEEEIFAEIFFQFFLCHCSRNSVCIPKRASNFSSYNQIWFTDMHLGIYSQNCIFLCISSVNFTFITYGIYFGILIVSAIQRTDYIIMTSKVNAKDKVILITVLNTSSKCLLFECSRFLHPVYFRIKIKFVCRFANCLSVSYR